MTERLTDVEKVKGIVNITEPYETRCLCNTSEDWEKYDVDQIHISVPDLTASPSIKQMLSAIQLIKQFENNTGRVYVHCKAGRSRSATIVAAYLMATKAFNPEKDVEEIKKHRSHIVIRSPILMRSRSAHGRKRGWSLVKRTK